MLKIGEGVSLPPNQLQIRRGYDAYSAREGKHAGVEQGRGGMISMGTGEVEALNVDTTTEIVLNKPGIGLDKTTLGVKKTIGIDIKG